MRLSDYEKQVLREIEAWQRDDGTALVRAISWAMLPVDWLVDSFVPDRVTDQLGEAVGQALGMLSDTAAWTLDAPGLLRRAAELGITAERTEDLRDADLELLDSLALQTLAENSLLAALEGGGMGLGGPALIAADIPLLFAINFRLLLQIGASYGFAMQSPDYRDLVLAIFNVAASGTREAKSSAMREVSVAAASFAHDFTYSGRGMGDTFRNQNRHLPREIGKNLLGRKLAQLVPLAGAAVGAGVNYWFTQQTAAAARMIFRAIYIERRERV
ncbi:MAG: EcsC family protein [Chloroflexi bacterium]|nr:EcsC family protein [Chloroflexota bacterium]